MVRKSRESRHYMLLEGTDARVHLLYYTPEMEDARSQGKLRVNNFVRLRRQFVNGQPLLEIDDRGDANAVLKNKAFLSDAAQRLIKRGVIPTEEGWGGWLGAYQRADTSGRDGEGHGAVQTKATARRAMIACPEQHCFRSRRFAGGNVQLPMRGWVFAS